MVASLNSENFKDLEDGMQMQCAVVEDLDYIITRNIKDFAASKVEALSPEDFLEILGES